jgi:hypothetical protein
MSALTTGDVLLLGACLCAALAYPVYILVSALRQWRRASRDEDARLAAYAREYREMRDAEFERNRERWIGMRARAKDAATKGTA